MADDADDGAGYPPDFVTADVSNADRQRLVREFDEVMANRGPPGDYSRNQALVDAMRLSATVVSLADELDWPTDPNQLGSLVRQAMLDLERRDAESG